MKSETILEKVNIDNSKVQEWLDKGLKITFPMEERDDYHESDDGVFIESADKYFPPLTKEEKELYTKKPEVFKEDFLQNVELYFDFHTFLYEKSQQVDEISDEREKMTALLALLYLFVSGMDHHYYHFDRYLGYEKYPDTPLGYWWDKLKDLYEEVFGGKVYHDNPPEKFLELLAQDNDVIKKFEDELNQSKYKELRKSLRALETFEEAQQREIEIISGYPNDEDLLFKTGLGLWERVCDVIDKNPEKVLKEKGREKIQELTKGHPIVATRKLLLKPNLKLFKDDIYSNFKEEISRWTK